MADTVIASRVQQLVELLRLQPHPEGGHYAQVFKSSCAVAPEDGRGARSALTSIYFLLPAGSHSRWHRVGSDEVWHFYEGAPLELLEMPPALDQLATHRLGPLDAAQAPTRTIPARHWQAARTTGLYSLVGCTVGPGFEFEDFMLLGDDAALATAVRRRFPAAAELM